MKQSHKQKKNVNVWNVQIGTDQFYSQSYLHENHNELTFFSFCVETARTPEALQPLQEAISVSLQLFIMQSKA